MARTLCEICREIPFRKLRTRDLYSDEQTKWALGTPEEIRQRPNCPFCRLVEQAIRDVRMLSVRDAMSTVRTIEVEWYNSQGRFLMVKLSLGVAIRFVGSAESRLFGSVPGARQIVGRQFDIDMIKSWVNTCQNEHHGTCRPPSPDAEDLQLTCFRLIDVKRLCIVPASIKERYVALSYVWGQAKVFRLLKENQEQLAHTQGLADHWDDLPLTIQDALLLVQKLDLPYLWVDSICLVQDDPEDMKAGISVMDTIYEQSIFTMLAASGTHANHGIPGVRDDTRDIAQEVCEVEPDLKLVLNLEMETLLKTTTYNTRAWTFQEYFLSYRRLVLVQDLCFFQCRQTTQAEDVMETAAEPNTATMMNLIQDEDTNSYAALTGALFYYTSRSMTQQSDALNAMAGISKRIGKKAGMRFLQGIPVAAFELYLLFFPGRNIPLRRRVGFPSWSWCGWLHQIVYDFLTEEGNENDWLVRNTWIQWYKRSLSGFLSLVWDPEVASDLPKADVQYANSRPRSVFRPPSGFLNIRTTRTTPTWELEGLSLPPSYPLLQFWTLSADFRLRKPDKPLLTQYDEVFDILNNYDQRCGFIIPDTDDLSVADAEPIELILLTRGGSRLSEFAFPGEQNIVEKLYWVMYIEWDGRVSERRGLGQMYQHALSDAVSGPIWKEIVLG